MQLFYERRTFSLLRWRLGGVPRCMGRSGGKRNAPTTGRRGRRPLRNVGGVCMLPTTGRRGRRPLQMTVFSTV